MTILLAITAAAIPILVPATQGRKVREAARLVNSFFNTARAKAIDSGRPVGVMLERSETNRLACNRLSMVEVPVPYSGDSSDARATITVDNNLGINPSAPPIVSPNTAAFPALPVSPLFRHVYTIKVTAGGMKVGDKIRIRGWDFTLYGPDGASWGTLGETADPDGVLDFFDSSNAQVQLYYAWRDDRAGETLPPFINKDMPYQIFRQPERSTTSTLQLPEGTVIDTYWSGLGPNGLSSDPVTLTVTPAALLGNVSVLFNSSGDVDSITAAGSRLPMTDTLYLLIGKPEGMAFSYAGKTAASTPVLTMLNNRNPVDNPRTPENLLDLTNFWITVTPQAGRVATIENAVVTTTYNGSPINPPPPTIPPTPPDITNGSTTPTGKVEAQYQVQRARALAIEGESTGGK